MKILWQFGDLLQTIRAKIYLFKMKNLSILIFCLIGVTTINSQTWIGGTGDWDVPSNWSSGVLPTSNSGAIIDGASSIVTVPAGFLAACNSVRVENGAQLTIESGACFDMHGSANFSLNISGGSTLINDGTINGNHSNGRRAANFSATVVNNGTMNFDNCGTSSITRGDGIRISGGTFTNNGDVNIGPNLTEHGIEMSGNAVIDNNGQINILGAGPDAEDDGLNLETGSAAFNNNAGGTLCIEDTNVAGDVIDPNLTYTNNGTENTSGCAASGNTLACSAQTIPTMGEWALIILGLIVLSFGVVYVMKWQKEKKLGMAIQ